MQPTTPGFVLTSLSFNTSEKKKTAATQWPQHEQRSHSAITKFDYCLPPDDCNYLDGTDNLVSV